MISHCGFDLHFPVISNIERLFMCLLAIYTSSSEKCLINSSAGFLIRLLFFVLSLVVD